MDSRISRGGDRGHIHGHRCHDLKMIEMASRSKKKIKTQKQGISLNIQKVHVLGTSDLITIEK